MGGASERRAAASPAGLAWRERPRAQGKGAIDRSKPGHDLYRMFRDPGRRARPVHKRHHHSDIHERLISPSAASRSPHLDTGVYQGGSSEMWRACLGPRGPRRGHRSLRAAYAGKEPRSSSAIKPTRRSRGASSTRSGRPASWSVTAAAPRTGRSPRSTRSTRPSPCPGVRLAEDTHTAFRGSAYADRHDRRSSLDRAFDRCRPAAPQVDDAAPRLRALRHAQAASGSDDAGVRVLPPHRVGVLLRQRRVVRTGRPAGTLARGPLAQIVVGRLRSGAWRCSPKRKAGAR